MQEPTRIANLFFYRGRFLQLRSIFSRLSFPFTFSGLFQSKESHLYTRAPPPQIMAHLIPTFHVSGILPNKVVQIATSTLQHLKRLMIILPPFLTLSTAQRRARFNELSRICDHHLEEAYSQVPKSPWSIETAVAAKSRPRNRYLNVFPWDRTRVALPVTGKNGWDYINASWVNLSPEARYIAAQGPLRGTIHHFWAMCFDQAIKLGSDTVVIAMVTPLVEMGREKCNKYWPSQNHSHWDMSEALQRDEIAPGKLTVTWIGEELHNDGFTVTTLSLQSGDISKKVLHFYYEGWQDTKVPDAVEPLISLSEEIAAVRAEYPRVVPIVHCSAGVGRTGTFIAIDYLRHFSNPFDCTSVDPVLDLVKKLRGERMMMVQTEHQYVFLYEVLTRMYKEQKTKN